MEEVGQPLLDEKTFNDLLVSISPALMKKARGLKRGSSDPRENAKDLHSATMVHALENRHMFRKGSFSGWMHTMMLNLHYNEIRRLRTKFGSVIYYGDAEEEGIAVPATKAVQFENVRLRQIFQLAESWNSRKKQDFQEIVEERYEGKRKYTWLMRQALKKADV